MPRGKKSKRITITVPPDIWERLEIFRDEVNVSEVCSTALDAYLQGLEVRKIESYRELGANYITQYPERGEPLERGEEVPLPAAYVERMLDMQKHEQAAALRAWRAGTVDAWQRIAHTPLPFEYKPPKDEPEK